MLAFSAAILAMVAAFVTAWYFGQLPKAVTDKLPPFEQFKRPTETYEVCFLAGQAFMTLMSTAVVVGVMLSSPEDFLEFCLSEATWATL